MSSHHGPPNQRPSWGYPCGNPTLPAPIGIPNASSGQMLNTSCSTRTPTRSCHPPPVSAQQHLPLGAHPHSASYSQQLDAGALPPSSGCYVSPRSQNTPHIRPAPVFVSGLISALVSSSSVSTPSITGLRSSFSL